MMVTDNEIDISFFCIGNLFYSFNSAIKRNNQGYTVMVGIINGLKGNTISFGIAVGNIKIKFRVIFFQERIDHSNRSSSVNIIITVYQNLFSLRDGSFESFYCLLHVIHQE